MKTIVLSLGALVATSAVASGLTITQSNKLAHDAVIAHQTAYRQVERLGAIGSQTVSTDQVVRNEYFSTPVLEVVGTSIVHRKN